MPRAKKTQPKREEQFWEAMTNAAPPEAPAAGEQLSFDALYEVMSRLEQEAKAMRADQDMYDEMLRKERLRRLHGDPLSDARYRHSLLEAQLYRNYIVSFDDPGPPPAPPPQPMATVTDTDLDAMFEGIESKK